MNDELRAAAERWRMFCDKISAIEINMDKIDEWCAELKMHWDEYPGGLDQADSDKVTLSSAYLAMNDDDHADTARLEWLWAHVKPTSVLQSRLTFRLVTAAIHTDSDDMRTLIDHAMAMDREQTNQP